MRQAVCTYGQMLSLWDTVVLVVAAFATSAAALSYHILKQMQTEHNLHALNLRGEFREGEWSLPSKASSAAFAAKIQTGVKRKLPRCPLRIVWESLWPQAIPRMPGTFTRMSVRA